MDSEDDFDMHDANDDEEEDNEDDFYSGGDDDAPAGMDSDDADNNDFEFGDNDSDDSDDIWHRHQVALLNRCNFSQKTKQFFIFCFFWRSDCGDVNSASFLMLGFVWAVWIELYYDCDNLKVLLKFLHQHPCACVI